MDIRHYSTIGSVMVATACAAVAIKLSTLYSIAPAPKPKKKVKPKASALNPHKSHIKMVQFSYRGYQIVAAADKLHFKNNKLILNIKKTMRLLQRKLLPITPFFVVYYSAYSGDELSIIEVNILMTHLSTINERSSWLEEECSDGFMIEPQTMYPI
eukprot:UN13268